MDREPSKLNASRAVMPFVSYRQHLKARFPQLASVRKICLDGGFTCPNLDGTRGKGGCTYCNNKSFSPAFGKSNVPIADQVQVGVQFMEERHGPSGYIVYFQAYSNTYASVERLRKLYTEALAHPSVVGLAVGTRPDCLGPGVIELLEELAQQYYVSLELGLQSSSDATLLRIKRGHDFSEFAQAMNRCQKRAFDLCIHIILGLPGESKKDFRNTAQALREWDYHSIKIHPLHVVKGTQLAREYERGLFSPLTMEAYVESLVDFLEWIPAEVAVQRYTGDADADILIAPDWCRRKLDIQNAMVREFRRRGTKQGSHFPGRLALQNPDNLAPIPNLATS